MDPEIVRALRAVIDPELGIDVVSLGLIYGAEREGGTAKVTMTMTSPACPMGSMLLDDAKEVVESTVSGIEHAEVELVFEPRWTPERMSDEARRALGYQAPPMEMETK